MIFTEPLMHYSIKSKTRSSKTLRRTLLGCIHRIQINENNMLVGFFDMMYDKTE